jgi:hypothetical protein
MKRRFLARFGTVAPASLLLTSPLHTRGLRALARRDQERPGSLPSEAPVKLASYITAEGRHGFGAQSADSSRLCNLARSDVPTLQDALAQWGLDEIRNRSVRASYEVKADTVRWLPPIPRPGKIFCVGINYRAHGAEAGREMPEHPSLFLRLPDSLVGHGEPVLVPTSSAHWISRRSWRL